VIECLKSVNIFGEVMMKSLVSGFFLTHGVYAYLYTYRSAYTDLLMHVRVSMRLPALQCNYTRTSKSTKVFRTFNSFMPQVSGDSLHCG